MRSKHVINHLKGRWRKSDSGGTGDEGRVKGTGTIGFITNIYLSVHQPSTNHHQPTTINQQPTTINQQCSPSLPWSRPDWLQGGMGISGETFRSWLNGNSKTVHSHRMNRSSRFIICFFVEHPHVYTLGRSGDENNLLLDEEGLKPLTLLLQNNRGEISPSWPRQIV